MNEEQKSLTKLLEETVKLLHEQNVKKPPSTLENINKISGLIGIVLAFIALFGYMTSYSVLPEKVINIELELKTIRAEANMAAQKAVALEKDVAHLTQQINKLSNK